MPQYSTADLESASLDHAQPSAVLRISPPSRRGTSMSHREPCRPNDSADSIELRAAARFPKKSHHRFADDRAAAHHPINFDSRDDDVELMMGERGGAAGGVQDDRGVSMPTPAYPAEIRRSPLRRETEAAPMMASGVVLEKKCTRLCKAAKMGRLDVVERLVVQHPQLLDSFEPCTGRTPLHCAARKNRWRVAAFLLTRGANANAADRDGMAPLHLAAVCAASHDVGASSSTRLDDSCSSSAFDLDESADRSVLRTDIVMLRPRGEDEDNNTTSPGDERPRRRLVSSSPEARQQHSSSLIRPSIPGQPEVHPHSEEFQSLVESGKRGPSNVPSQGYQCRPPADSAEEDALLRALNTLDPVTPDKQQQRAPGRLRMRRYQPASPGPQETASKAASGSAAPPGVESPHAPNKPQNQEQTPAMPLIDVLVRHGAAVDAKDRHGRTPLHWASWKDMGASTAALLLHGADPDIHDNDGRLPVHLASIAGSLKVSDPLLLFLVPCLPFLAPSALLRGGSCLPSFSK